MKNREQQIVNEIYAKLNKANIDNISRTKAYQTYYLNNKEIQWAFLASMVSRNAGWAMTDLEGIWFKQLFSKELRDNIFKTYERANWQIFQDVYPQLLLYEYSKYEKKPLFHLLKEFYISKFMVQEWNRFWHNKEQKRLVTALIINEQNVIEKPVLKHKDCKKKVLNTIPFIFQNHLHFSSVIFPTLQGDIYGFSVHDFTKVKDRIELGKKLTWLLFHPNFHQKFLSFALKTEHTGSRLDYERYIDNNKIRESPMLRTIYPIVSHHQRACSDWFNGKSKKYWFRELTIPNPYEITKWHQKKENQLKSAVLLKSMIPFRFNNKK